MGTREKWLLTILTGIFIIQASILIYGIRLCANATVKMNTHVEQVCPQIGERLDLTFGTMVATTLALLTGSTLASQPKKNNNNKPPNYIPPQPGRQ